MNKLILGFLISRVLAARRHPDLLAERARFTQHGDAKSWDKLLTHLATPLFLDSLWAFFPAVFITTLLVIHTALEDSALKDELESYRTYAGREGTSCIQAAHKLVVTNITCEW
jgi:hypothetical protein